MFRFYYTIVMRIGSIIHFVPKMRKYAKHPEVYSEEDCHELCKVMIAKVAKTARTTTSYYGLENLPTDGGISCTPTIRASTMPWGSCGDIPAPAAC